MIQNTAAMITTRSRKYDHITPVLVNFLVASNRAANSIKADLTDFQSLTQNILVYTRPGPGLQAK